MIELPALPFNPLTAATPLSAREILAGPFGLLVFIPLVPITLLVARRYPRLGLCGGGVAWLLVTLRVPATAALLVYLAVSVGWLLGLAWLRRRGLIGQRAMIALVWAGLHALTLPLWWWSQPAWYLDVSRMSALHNVGFAYLMLRLIAWGVDLARRPTAPLRLADTACWLLYAPCMRLGPVFLRESFLARLDAWRPLAVRRGGLTLQGCGPDWRGGARRFGLFLLGGVALGFVGKQIPRLVHAGDFFAVPQAYSTGELLRAAYLIPIHVYLILWTYNELAAALSRWIGIPVDDNFRWLPRSASVREFWQRWHVTLGAWLRDYIYIPLGGNRRHVFLNYLVVFGYCGIWHGPSWSFLAWGLSQAVVLAGQRVWDRRPWRRARPLLPQPVRTAICWLLTMHYQLATILVFVDFSHLGWRLGTELLRRLSGLGPGPG